MSDHAAVKDEHRKLAAALVDGDGIPAEWYKERDEKRSREIEISWTAQLLADFAREEQLKEAEWRANHWPPLGALISVESLQRWIAERGIENAERIEQLKRGGL